MNIDSIGRPRKPDKKGGYQRTVKPKLQYRRPEKKIYNKFSIAELTGEKFVKAANQLIAQTLRKVE